MSKLSKLINSLPKEIRDPQDNNIVYRLQIDCSLIEEWWRIKYNYDYGDTTFLVVSNKSLKKAVKAMLDKINKKTLNKTTIEEATAIVKFLKSTDFKDLQIIIAGVVCNTPDEPKSIVIEGDIFRKDVNMISVSKRFATEIAVKNKNIFDVIKSFISDLQYNKYEFIEEFEQKIIEELKEKQITTIS